MSLSDKIIWSIVALILIPVLLNPAGAAFGVTIAAVWLIGAYALRYFLNLEKQRRQGERGFINDVRNKGRGGQE